MDLDPRSSQKVSDPGVLSKQGSPGNDQKELAWAFLGLILWSAVVLGAIFGVGYVIGHSVFHWW
jgi:hypothetical protein